MTGKVLPFPIIDAESRKRLIRNRAERDGIAVDCPLAAKMTTDDLIPLASFFNRDGIDVVSAIMAEWTLEANFQRLRRAYVLLDPVEAAAVSVATYRRLPEHEHDGFADFLTRLAHGR